MEKKFSRITRRHFLQGATALGLLTGLESLVPVYARQSLVHAAGTGSGEGTVIDLAIRKQSLKINGRQAMAVTVNGTVPGPLLRFREGRTAVIRVTNHLEEDTSIHWHGILLPANMDGVPGVSFNGIKPGETFTYRFPLVQSGTYWYHSHSGLQEQSGLFGPLIIDPAEEEPAPYDREYIVMLSDWTFEDPHKILANLKKVAGYYNFQKRTVGDLFRDSSRSGWKAAMADRIEWGRMRMDPTDIADVTGYAYNYLLNGLPPANWTGHFRPGERVRLRFINAGAGTYFDVRIPGLEMTVVQADGQNVQPVTVDEFRIAIAETYDVIVTPREERAYTIFAETMDRSGFASGILAPRPGMIAPLPQRRLRPILTMADMGMGNARGMGAMGMGAQENDQGHAMAGGNASSHGGMPGMSEKGNKDPDSGNGKPVMHGPDHHGPGNSMVAMTSRPRLHERGLGLEDAPWRVLVYSDLRSLHLLADQRPPGREIELHLTGNMERYMWSFDGKKFSEDVDPIRFILGERLRLTLVNDTMMEHPIHLHGMFMVLDNGAGRQRPNKHTVSVKPAERLSVDITADAPGDWAFHCHILNHMMTGMFRVVSVLPKGVKP